MICWLPSMVSVDGTWPEIISRLYRVFVADIKDGHPYFQGSEIWWDRRILPGEEFEEGFWHLTTRAAVTTNERLLDHRRAERLPWCAPAIGHGADDDVLIWDYEEGSRKVRTYIWLPECDYVVILERQARGLKRVAFLITAFHVDGESTRQSLRRKYRARCL